MKKMKILWVLNMILPELSEYMNKKNIQTSGTWLNEIIEKMRSTGDVELSVVCLFGKEFIDVVLNNVRYFVIPGNGNSLLFYNKKLIKYWDIIEERFNPDLIHIHGTEYSHTISYLRKYPQKKKVVTIQGIIGKIAGNINADLSFWETIRFRTLKECIKLNGMVERQILFQKNIKYENEILRSVNYVSGRYDWDKYYSLSVNPSLKYFRCRYSLRDNFYDAPKWAPDSMERHTIYGSTAAQTPLKGGHILLKALTIVRMKYPNVKARFLMPDSRDGKFFIKNGYTKYIRHIIDKYNLWNNVEFVPSLSSQGVVKLMLSSNVTVIPSAMENGSTTLRESMHLGVPSIAAFRGGMAELLSDRINGFYFDFADYQYLAGRIMEVFGSDEIAMELSKNAIVVAEVIHDREKNVRDFINMYTTIIQSID